MSVKSEDTPLPISLFLEGANAETLRRLDFLFDDIRQAFKEYRFWADEIRLILWQPMILPSVVNLPHTYLDKIAAWEILLESIGFGNPSMFSTLRDSYIRAINTLRDLQAGAGIHTPASAEIAYRTCFGKYQGSELLTGTVTTVEDTLGLLLDYVRETSNNHDALTGCPNRYLCDRFLAELSISAEPGTLGVIMVDIDYFKKVNDTLGHDAGDLVLRDVARVLRGVSRGQERTTTAKRNLPGIFRYGGEEFVYPVQTPQKNLLGIGERLRRAVCETPLRGGIPVTVSVGVASGGPANDVTLAMDLADQALYQAKLAGRNRCVAAETSEN